LTVFVVIYAEGLKAQIDGARVGNPSQIEYPGVILAVMWWAKPAHIERA